MFFACKKIGGLKINGYKYFIGDHTGTRMQNNQCGGRYIKRSAVYGDDWITGNGGEGGKRTSQSCVEELWHIISTGETEFKGIVKNNETAAFIVECLKTDTDENAIVDKLLAEYTGVDRQTVQRDVAAVIGKLRSIGAIIE